MPRPKKTKKALPPSNDPQRPPKGPGSGSLPRGRCCGSQGVYCYDHLSMRISNATALELADAPDDDD